MVDSTLDTQSQMRLRGTGRSAAFCSVCTIRLERLCRRRALWFRVLRAGLAGAVRVWSLWHPVDPVFYELRSPACRGCFRFRKNVLKEKSRFFRWLDSYVNPVFNWARDSLLLPGEKDSARVHATQAANATAGPSQRRPPLEHGMFGPFDPAATGLEPRR